MAQPTNTFDTYDAKGIREDLSDFIYNISPTKTPAIQMFGKGKAKNTYFEWQTDELAAAATNYVIEGDEATLDAVTASVRVGNYTQISDKTAVITGTEEAVDKAGRTKEMAYQVKKKTEELKRDMEKMVTDNNARVAGNASTARETAGLGAWVATNTDAGAGGSDPTGDGTDARTDGTPRAFTEAQLKAVLKSCWDEGGEPDCLMVGGFNKQKASTFTGNATRQDKSEDKKLTAAIDVYVSDFGTIQIVPNRFSRARDAWVLQKDMWCVDYLRPARNWPLSKTGDTEKRQILVEFGLRSKQQKASGLVADLTTS